jgi:hypothetical protein
VQARVAQRALDKTAVEDERAHGRAQLEEGWEVSTTVPRCAGGGKLFGTSLL